MTVSTVLLVLATHNLAVGVVGGVLVASVLFVRRVAHFVTVRRMLGASDVVTHVVEEELFFASSNDLKTLFSYSSDPGRVVIDLSGSHEWDASTVAALDAIETKYAALGKTVEVVGMNETSQRMRGRLTGRFEEKAQRDFRRPSICLDNMLECCEAASCPPLDIIR